MTFRNAISWFEIAANDFERAVKFYETIFGCSLQQVEMEGSKMGMFPVEDGTVGGAIVSASDMNVTGRDGPFIYLNGGDDLQNVLDKVEAAGGKIEMPKMQITPEYGNMAVFTDTEGNKIGLHSMG